MIRARNPRPRRREAGFSLVELVIAMAVMAIALLALTVSITSASRVNDASRERAQAYELAKSKIEEIRNFTYCSTFSNIYWWYACQSATVPGPGGTPLTKAGAYSTVYNQDPLLRPNTNTLDPLHPASGTYLNPAFLNGVEQPIITISFPNNGGVLSESPPANSVWVTKFGFPKDLNRNGKIDSPDVVSGLPVLYDPGGANGVNPPTSPYTILPVLVTVQWESAGKKSAYVEVSTMITAK
jgi:prepilin-type N-terminal cleavage/methylation domain-containing protein